MIAIAGVVAGALLTFLTQFVLWHRAERARRRTELLDLCAAFAASAENARGAQYDRWWSKHEQRSSEARQAAKEVSYQRRTEMRVSQSRLRLLGLGGEAGASAENVVTVVGDLHKAGTRGELEASGRLALAAINSFTDAAMKLL